MSFLSEYPQFTNRYPATGGWKTLREQGHATLSQKTLPDTTEAAWRFSRIKSMESPVTATVPTDALRPAFLEKARQPYFELSQEIQLHAPTTVGGLSWALLEDVISGRHARSEQWWQLFQKAMRPNQDPLFTRALGDAYLGKGLFIHVEPNTRIESLGILYRLLAGAREFPRIILFVDENSYISLTEEVIAGDTGFFSPNVEIYLAPKAVMKHHRIELQTRGCSVYGHTSVSVAQEGAYALLSLQGGSATTHQETHLHIDGANCKTSLRGLSLGIGNPVFENFVSVHHHVPRSTSEQFFKSVLADSSRVVFRGEIHIDEGAIDTSSHQLSRGLLLNPQCQAITEPVLEIAADDVEATHGSSTGELNEEELFYLESRGIEKAMAKRLIALGFILDVLESVTDTSLREWADQELSVITERIFPR